MDIFGFLMGFGGDLLLDELRKNVDANVDRSATSCLKKAAQQTILKNIDCNEGKITDYLKNKEINAPKVIELLSCNDKELQDFLLEMIQSLETTKFDQDLFLQNKNGRLDEFRERLACTIVNEQALSNYLLILANDRRRKDREINTAEWESLSEEIICSINVERNAGMNLHQIDCGEIMYKHVKRRLTPSCSDEMIRLAYVLTDIYDHTGEAEKAVTIARKILQVISKKNTPDSYDHLERLIGCAYSITIAKVDDKTKEKNLREAQKLYEDIENRLKSWQNTTTCDGVDINYILSLFESDYGAYHTNVSDLEIRKNEGDKTDVSMKNLAQALNYHQQALSHRREIVDMIDSNHEGYSFYEDLVYQSRSNIAGVYFRDNNPLAALKEHKEILNYRKRNGETARSILTRDYIIGCISELSVAGKEITPEDKKLCKESIELCRKHFRYNPDKLATLEEKVNQIDWL